MRIQCWCGRWYGLEVIISAATTIYLPTDVVAETQTFVYLTTYVLGSG
jgi:hypothetical protein